MTTKLRINYVELPANDFAKVEAFYSGAFGWTFTSYGDMYHAFNDGSLNGGFTKSDASSTTATGGALIVLYAEDLEAARAAVLEHGGALIKDVFSFPGGRRFQFSDPCGNELAIWSDK